MIRLTAQKVIKSLNKNISSDNILLPNKLFKELRTKFSNLPQSLADLESEIMNFNVQLSCQGTVKDDVRNFFLLKERRALNSIYKVIRLYQKEKVNLMQIENRIHDLENKIKQGQINAETSKTNWLNQVNRMINEINEKFVDLFNTMGCKGQVCLETPESLVRIFYFYS